MSFACKNNEALSQFMGRCDAPMHKHERSRDTTDYSVHICVGRFEFSFGPRPDKNRRF